MNALFNALYFFSKSARTLTHFIFAINVRNNYVPYIVVIRNLIFCCQLLRWSFYCFACLTLSLYFCSPYLLLKIRHSGSPPPRSPNKWESRFWMGEQDPRGRAQCYYVKDECTMRFTCSGIPAWVSIGMGIVTGSHGAHDLARLQDVKPYHQFSFQYLSWPMSEWLPDTQRSRLSGDGYLHPPI